MKTFSRIKKKARHLHAFISSELSLLAEHVCALAKRLYWFLVFRGSPLLVQTCYFVSLSLAGFLALRILEARRTRSSDQPKADVDLLFTSVSALTMSSIATVEMEAFSQPQLWVLVLLILLGGEVFISMLGLRFVRSRMEREAESANVENGSSTKPETIVDVEYLGYVVLAYLVSVLGIGSALAYLYLALVPSARDVLSSKGIPVATFAVFLTVSSFGNCGFVPTNENMMAFKRNSALLLMTVFQILAGNTLYPPCLRSAIWALKKLKAGDVVSFDRILRTQGEAVGYQHLLSSRKSACLASTVCGFLLVQVVLFCALEWNSDGLQGMNSYQKVVGALFLSVNSRHAGESIVDLSTLSTALLVLYIVMMYLPPYTTFILPPMKEEEEGSMLVAHEKEEEGVKKKRKELVKDLIMLSNLSYVVIFILLICITERRALSADPLNFNVLNIVFEVISAYGNVGFSIGYSCQRLLSPSSHCKNAWFGFAGRWSNKGKLILVLVMHFGRLKKFNMKGGKAWELS